MQQQNIRHLGPVSLSLLYAIAVFSFLLPSSLIPSKVSKLLCKFKWRHRGLKDINILYIFRKKGSGWKRGKINLFAEEKTTEELKHILNTRQSKKEKATGSQPLAPLLMGLFASCSSQ